MIDRLQRELSQLGRLPPEEQEELALYIEALIETHRREVDQPHIASATGWKDPAGEWSDLPEDDEVEAFDRMRHDTEPSAPIEL